MPNINPSNDSDMVIAIISPTIAYPFVPAFTSDTLFTIIGLCLSTALTVPSLFLTICAPQSGQNFGKPFDASIFAPQFLQVIFHPPFPNKIYFIVIIIPFRNYVKRI